MSALEQFTATFRACWQNADHVLIGAGAGLSAAAGIDYTDQNDFTRVFPALARRGFTARYELIGYPGLTPSQHWAYWATHVQNVRFGPRPHRAYSDLRELVRDKDSFVLTSNVDAMFARNGFAEQRIFTPQGDYAAMQCRKPCRRTVWPSLPDITRVLEHLDAEGFEVEDPTVLPACPHCGGSVFLNVRLDAGFVDEPYRVQSAQLRTWLSGIATERILLLEVGAGFNTPGVIRWPMEALSRTMPNAQLFRINRDDAELGSAPPNRAFGIEGDASEILRTLAASCLGN